jgi:DNA-directed RNA polymerase subunit RPC12/RpoP
MQGIFDGTAWKSHLERQSPVAAKRPKRTVCNARGAATMTAVVSAASAASLWVAEYGALVVPPPVPTSPPVVRVPPAPTAPPVARAPSTPPSTPPSPPSYVPQPEVRPRPPPSDAEGAPEPTTELCYNGTPLHLLQVVLACAPGVNAMGAEGCHVARAGLGLLPTHDVCMKCGEEVNFLRATQKAKGKWLCRMCNSKTVRLTRVFGRWPPTEFLGLPDEVQKQFWADRASTLGDMKKTLTEMLSNQQIEHESTAVVGYGQPLSYWAQLGHDTERIKTETPHEGRQVEQPARMVLHRSRSQGVRGHITRASASTGDERFIQTSFFASWQEGH